MPGGFVTSAAWSPDGRWVVTGEGWPFFVARLWDARSGELLRIFAGNNAPVESVAFGPRGRSVLTGSEVVRLWSVADWAAHLTARPTNSGLALEWSQGNLQRAPGVAGPWETLEVRSPWSAPQEAAAGVFRVFLPDDED